MVRQAYGYRLALGRSAFELPVWPTGAGPEDDSPLNRSNDTNESSASTSSAYNQSFNVRGHPQNPESRALVRRNIRAHNEVLSTVDVCARVDSEGKDIAKPQRNARSASDRKQNLSILLENETGLWLGVADDLACLVATTFTANMRRRLETFSYYQGFSLLRIARVEFSCFGFLKFFFAGEFANTAFYVLTTTADAMIEVAHDYVVAQYAGVDIEKDAAGFKRAMDALEQVLKFASFCLLSPLQLFATLQRLDLLPAWPLVPNPLQLSCFAPLLPSLPVRWDRTTLPGFVASLATSPFITFLCMFYFTDKVKGKLCNYARAMIPRPDNPDNASFNIGLDDGTTGTAPVLDYPKFQGSLRQELQKDVQSVLAGFSDIRRRVRTNFRRLFDRRRPSVSFPVVVGRDIQSSPNSSNGPGQPGIRSTSSVAVQNSESLPLSSPPIVQPESSTVTSTSPPLTPTSSEDPEISADEPSNVRIRTRTGSTSTLHMDVEFNAPERGGPVLTSSFAASPRPAMLETTMCHASNRPHYRVTALTLHASDSLGAHVVGAVTSILRLPLESLYVRSLARNFLAAGAPENNWIFGHVYALHYWILPGYRGVSWQAFSDYAGKVLLCIGIETMITTKVWRLGCGIAEWAGRSWYAWGRL